MADDDDGPPPLEDMTAQLTLRQQLLGKPNPPAKAPTPDSATPLNTTKTPSASSAPAPASSSMAPEAAKRKSTPNSGGGFGGFNKGFLSGGKPPKATVKAATPKSATPNPSPAAAATRTTAPSEEEIPFLRASRDATAPGQLPEVQEAMSKASGFLNETKDQWLNSDLLEKLKKRPNLLRQLNDPKLAAALSEFQTDPGAAKAKYAGSPEITGFFKEFFEVMGQHMMELGDKEEAAKQAGAAAGPPVSSEDQAHLDKIMQDPEVVEALKHPGVQKLLQTLREQPQQGHIAMQAVSRDPELARRVKVLYGAGLLGVARNVPS